MRQLIVISSILLLLIGAWGCSENPEQSAKETVGVAEKKATDAAEPLQAGAGKAAEDVTEEEMKDKTEDSTEETKQ